MGRFQAELNASSQIGVCDVGSGEVTHFPSDDVRFARSHAGGTTDHIHRRTSSRLQTGGRPPRVYTRGETFDRDPMSRSFPRRVTLCSHWHERPSTDLGVEPPGHACHGTAEGKTPVTEPSKSRVGQNGPWKLQDRSEGHGRRGCHPSRRGNACSCLCDVAPRRGVQWEPSICGLPQPPAIFPDRQWRRSLPLAPSTLNVFTPRSGKRELSTTNRRG